MKSILTICFLFSLGSLNAQTDSSQITKTDSAVYYNPDTAAEYSGGRSAWTHYLQKNMRYPEKAQVKNIQGSVIVQFIVDSTGTTHDVSAVSGPEELRAECIRLINQSHLWVPAIYDGKNVNSWKRQQFNFKLESQ